MRVIKQSVRFNKLPSEIARINIEYEAFCFDEACMYIIEQIEDKKEPVFSEDRTDESTGERKTFLSEALKSKGGDVVCQ
jgi:hypothetical protein